MAPNLAARRELRGAAGLARNLGYGAGLFTAPSWMPAIFNLGQSSSPLTQAVNRIPGMRANPETDIGRRLGNWLSNEARYFGNQVSRGQTPYAPNAQQQQPLLGRVSAPGTDTGSWRGGAGSSNGARGGGGSPAAERAYQAEASRVAQMAAQNPDLQRYEAARQTAVAPGATPEQVQSAEDIGMRIWAEKYGKTLAPKVKPGQAGYDVIQGVLNTGKMGAPLDLPFNPSSVLSTEPVPASAEYGATAPAALPPEAALAANAFSNVQPGMFQRYRDQSALEVSPLYDSTISPLGTTPPLGALNYGGAVQPIGGNVVDEAFRGDKARQLAEMFKNAILTGNR